MSNHDETSWATGIDSGASDTTEPDTGQQSAVVESVVPSTPTPAASQPAAPEPAAPEPAAQPPPRKQRRWRRRRLPAVVLLVTGLALAAGGSTGIYLEMTRYATPAEVAAADQAEIASRWQRLTAGQVFPASAPYTTSDGVDVHAYRVGIAPPVPCAAGVDARLARVLDRNGCERMLRATYTDPSMTFVATAGVAVMPSAALATQAMQGIEGPGQHAGVQAVAFPGTVARLFTNPARLQFGITVTGPYIFFATSGYATGEHGPGTNAAAALSDLAQNLTGPEITTLTGGVNPCHRRDIRC